MKKLIGKLMLKLLGWKIVLEGDVNNLNRCILVVAPHTANEEYLLGNFAYWALEKPLKIIIKDAHTKSFRRRSSDGSKPFLPCQFFRAIRHILFR